MEAEFKKAVNLFEIDKIKQAKKICIKIYKKNPKHFDNLRLLNFIYFKEKNFYEALNIINEAIKINPNFAEAYSEQGNALNELKQLNMALKSYDNAIKINPNFSNAYYNKAVILHELKNIELAIENYDHSIKINPKHIHSHNNKGFALQQLKKFNESLNSYNNAYKINSNFNFLLGKIFHVKNLMCDWKSFDEFLNKNFFRYRSIIENKKTLEGKIAVIKSEEFFEYILEARDRILVYQNYVLGDMNNSASKLLEIIQKNIKNK